MEKHDLPEPKILQIIPATVPIFAEYRNDDGTILKCKVISFALMEQKQYDGEIIQFVQGLIIGGKEIYSPEDDTNFIGYTDAAD